MPIQINSYLEIAKKLKTNYPKLSEYEILTLAIQIERNQLLENGLTISRINKHPSALEAISICLGYSDKQFQQTIIEVIKSKGKVA